MSKARISAERLLCYGCVGLILIMAVWLFAPVVWRFLSPFLIALPIAAMLQPVTRFLETKLRMRHGAAVVLPVILLCTILVGLIVWFGSFGVNQVTYLLNNSGTIIRDEAGTMRTAINRFIDKIKEVTGGRINLAAKENDQILTWISERASDLGKRILSKLPSMATGIPFAFVYVNILLFSVYFFSRDYAQIHALFLRHKIGDPASDTGKLTHSALTGLIGWLRVQAVYAILSFFAGSIYWAIMGNQYAMLIAIAASILEFLPLVGNGTIYYPWAIIALLEGNIGSAVQALGLFYGLLAVRRFTEPKLLSHNIGISPILSLISMFVGLRLGGILGMVFSPALAALAVTFWNGIYRKTIHSDIQEIQNWLRSRWKSQSSTDDSQMGNDTFIEHTEVSQNAQQHCGREAP